MDAWTSLRRASRIRQRIPGPTAASGRLAWATATRAAQVALYAQAVLFLAPFVDIGLGLPIASYADTYAAAFGSPGALVAGVAFALVVAWGAWDASLGRGRARQLNAAFAGIAAVLGLSFLAVPWPRPLVVTYVTWGVHLGIAVYYGILVCALLALTIRYANPSLHAAFWRRSEAWGLPIFALLPFLGIVAAGRLAVPPNPAEPVLRSQFEAPYNLGAAAVGVLLWAERRIVRERAWGPTRMEASRLLMIVALVAAFLLGWGAFVATLAAGVLVWSERDRSSPVVLGLVAALLVLLGDATVVAVDFADVTAGPLTLTIAAAQGEWPTLLGTVVAVGLGAIVGWTGSTSRTSA